MPFSPGEPACCKTPPPDTRSWIQTATILLVAVLLMASGAHLFSLGSKMRLSPQDYMVAQRAYDGWALFALPILAALLLHALALLPRAQ